MQSFYTHYLTNEHNIDTSYQVKLENQDTKKLSDELKYDLKGYILCS